MTSPAAASRRTTTSYVLLGLLAIRDWSTYELAQQMRRTVHWFWPRAERRLYDDPKALVAEGLATARHEFTGQRRRTVYAITPAGREALRGWLSQPASAPTIEFEAMVKVFFADAGTRDQLLDVLDSIEATAADRLTVLTTFARQGVAEHTPFPDRRHLNTLAVRLQVQQERVVLDWARWARAQVVQWNSSTDPGPWKAAEALADLLPSQDPQPACGAGAATR